MSKYDKNNLKTSQNVTATRLDDILRSGRRHESIHSYSFTLIPNHSKIYIQLYPKKRYPRIHDTNHKPSAIMLVCIFFFISNLSKFHAHFLILFCSDCMSNKCNLCFCCKECRVYTFEKKEDQFCVTQTKKRT